MTQMSTVYRGVVPGVAGGTMEDQLTLSQTGGTDYSHHITTPPSPGFSHSPTALWYVPFLWFPSRLLLVWLMILEILIVS